MQIEEVSGAKQKDLSDSVNLNVMTKEAFGFLFSFFAHDIMKLLWTVKRIF